MPSATIKQAMEIALEHHRSGRLAQAEAIYQQIIERDPNQPDAPHMLGVLRYQTGRPADGIPLIRRALELHPNWSQALGNLGVALNAAGQSEEAILCHRRELELAPTSPTALCNLGNALRSAGRFDQAIASHRRAIALRPDFSQAHHNLGNALRDQNNLEEAIEEYRQAISLQSNYADAHNSLGAALRVVGKNQDAIASFRRAIQLHPHHADAHLNLALITLLLGDFQAGWREYEWRWRIAGRPNPAKDFSQPRWDGSDLTGRTILLFAEQGIGDTVQFLRYLPSLARRGGRILLDVQPQLHRLLDPANLHGATLASRKSASFDTYLPLLSLPLMLGEFDFASPAILKPPYIQPNSILREKWRTLLGEKKNFKVGLAWAGSPTHTDDCRRSLPLAALAPLAQEQINFYSLQFGKAAAQSAQPPPGMNLIDLTSQITDFADTAALIAELDLVITVDTAAAHLAGAMAVPVWTLLPLAPDFRWLLNRDDTPWYPTMRLFRQTQVGQWTDPIDRLATELRRLI